jgi:hypothetical protein
MRTSVHLPDDLLRRARKKALAEGRTLTSLIEEGLRLIVNGMPKPEARKLPRTSSLPISKHSGGLRPGIDPIKIATQTQEMDDLEMLARLEKLR